MITAAAVVVVGCGGGGDGDDFFITISGDFATNLAQTSLSGTASLPDGSERAGGTPSMPIITCQIGPYALTWSNAADGSQGSGIELWNCPSDIVQWSAFQIPLKMGINRITVTVSDSKHTAAATVTVTRT